MCGSAWRAHGEPICSAAVFGLCYSTATKCCQIVDGDDAVTSCTGTGGGRWLRRWRSERHGGPTTGIHTALRSLRKLLLRHKNATSWVGSRCVPVVLFPSSYGCMNVHAGLWPRNCQLRRNCQLLLCGAAVRRNCQLLLCRGWLLG